MNGRLFLSSIVTTFLTTLPAWAQEEPQPILTPQFSFSNPGARSMGFGGAFVAVADDATAAFVNPAGLLQLAEPEISIEGRYWSYSTAYVAGGRIEGAPSGSGLDTTAGLRVEYSEDEASSLSFLSFVYPRKRWSLGLYRHVLANFESTSETQGFFAGGTDCCQIRYFADQRGRANLEVVSYGLAGAYRVTDAFSLGLGLIAYESSMSVSAGIYLPDDLSNPIGSPTSFLPEKLILEQTNFSDDSSFSFNAGFLWAPSPQWRVGGKYRGGPEVGASGRLLVGPALDLGLPPGTEVVADLGHTAYLPDVFGFGVAYRTVDGRVTAAFEWDRVTYSDPLSSLGVDDQEIDDADELHLGGEYVFLQTRPMLALRVGTWLDPDHLTRPKENANLFTRVLLPPGEDEIHFAVGIGAAFRKLNIDAGVDFSDSVDTVALSANYSF